MRTTKTDPPTIVCSSKPVLSDCRALNTEKAIQKQKSQADLQRNLMGKGARQKIETEDGVKVYKWKTERKR